MMNLLLRFAVAVGPNDFSGLRVKELQQQLKARGVSFADCFDKEDLMRKLAANHHLPAHESASSQGRPSPRRYDNSAAVANAEAGAGGIAGRRPGGAETDFTAMNTASVMYTLAVAVCGCALLLLALGTATQLFGALRHDVGGVLHRFRSRDDEFVKFKREAAAKAEAKAEARVSKGKTPAALYQAGSPTFLLVDPRLWGRVGVLCVSARLFFLLLTLEARHTLHSFDLGDELFGLQDTDTIVAAAYAALFAVVLPAGFFHLRERFQDDEPDARDAAQVG
jgi:hypothetical protein